MSYDAIVCLCKKCGQLKFTAVDNAKTRLLNKDEIDNLVKEGHTLTQMRPRLVYNYKACRCDIPKKQKR